MGENAIVTRHRAAALAVFALLGLAASSPAKDEFPVKVTVCVRGAEKGGFVTAEIGDSVKDLKEDLGDKDVLQLTDDAKSADIVVLIQGRGNVETGRRVYRSHSGRRHYRSTSSKETVRVVRGTLVAGTYKVDMVGVNASLWGKAADNLGEKVEHWAKNNYPQLMGRREKKEATFSSAGVDSEDEGDDEASASADAGSSAGGDKEAEIKPGMTAKEVLAELGDPTKKVAFGKKTQWVYKNMTIVFEAGKVTDVKF